MVRIDEIGNHAAKNWEHFDLLRKPAKVVDEKLKQQLF